MKCFRCNITITNALSIKSFCRFEIIINSLGLYTEINFSSSSNVEGVLRYSVLYSNTLVFPVITSIFEIPTTIDSFPNCEILLSQTQQVLFVRITLS